MASPGGHACREGPIVQCKIIFLRGIALLFTLGSTATFPYGALADANAVSVEILGRGLLYTFEYDRVIFSQWGLGAGISRSDGQVAEGQDTGKSTLLLPIYANYYWTHLETGTFFATFGITWVTSAGEVAGLQAVRGGVEFTASPLLPTLGLGYEAREENGFLFRFSGYVMKSRVLATGLGATWGYCF